MKYLRRLFGQNENFNDCLSAKRRSLLHPTRHNDLFSYYNLFLGKLKEKLARNAHVNTDANTSDRAHAPRASYNTP